MIYHIIGIDPGLSKTGIAIIEINNNSIQEIKTVFISTTTKDINRIQNIINHIIYILMRYRKSIKCLFIERVFFNQNITSFNQVTQVVGTIKYFSNFFNITTKELTPLVIKKFITGNGRSEKSQVLKWLLSKYKIHNFLYCSNLTKDEIDAVACAITGWKNQQI